MDAANVMNNIQPKTSPNNDLVKTKPLDKAKTQNGSMQDKNKQGQSFGTTFEQIVNAAAAEEDNKAKNQDSVVTLGALAGQPVVLLQLKTVPQLDQAITMEAAIAVDNITNDNAAANTANLGNAAGMSSLQSSAGAKLIGTEALQTTDFTKILLNQQTEQISPQSAAANTQANTKIAAEQMPQTVLLANLNTSLSEAASPMVKEQLNGSKVNIANPVISAAASTLAKADLAQTDTNGKNYQLTNNGLNSSVNNSLKADSTVSNFTASDNQQNNLLFKQNGGQQADDKLTGDNNPADLFMTKNMPINSETVSNTAVTPLNTEAIMPQESSSNQQPFLINNIVDLRSDTLSMSNTASADSSAGAATPNYDIPDQIIQQAKLIKTAEDTQMIIKLKPEHLGELSLKVSVENGVVSASFHSDNAQVRAIIETSLIQLKQELAAQGIKVDSVSVYSGMGDLLSNGQQQAGREQQNSRYKNRKIDLNDFTEEVDKIVPVTANVSSEEGVDYRI